MIKSFRSIETERLFMRHWAAHFPPDIQRGALRKLLVLDAAEDVADLRNPPGNHLEKLYGDREGQYSIRVNKQWRVCFRWFDGDAYEVEIVDYH
jgi:proteic killer suppression protein